MNGKLVDSVNYTVEEGSTIITLKKDYVKTLKNGTYNMQAKFVNNNINFDMSIKIVNPKTGLLNVTLISSILILLLCAFVILINKNKKFV